LVGYLRVFKSALSLKKGRVFLLPLFFLIVDDHFLRIRTQSHSVDIKSVALDPQQVRGGPAMGVS
jgi:hypothetical protein